MPIDPAPDPSTPPGWPAAARVRLLPAWLSPAQADALFDRLRDDIPWEVHRIRLFGREVDSPRRSCWIGDADATYRYSGTRFAPRPWTAELQAVRSRLREELGIDCNSVLANLYRDGRDAMGWHADDERGLGPQPVIASLSLGAPRRFRMRTRATPRRVREWLLQPGDLLVMSGDCQALCQHALPRTARPVGPRINLTFRRIVAPAP